MEAFCEHRKYMTGSTRVGARSSAAAWSASKLLELCGAPPAVLGACAPAATAPLGEAGGATAALSTAAPGSASCKHTQALSSFRDLWSAYVTGFCDSEISPERTTSSPALLNFTRPSAMALPWQFPFPFKVVVPRNACTQRLLSSV